MATSLPDETKKKLNVKGGQRFPRLSFAPKKLTLTAPTLGLEHIVLDNTGTAKAASTFNLNIQAISKHPTNRLKFDSPLA
jgi:hypothetical protein